MKRKFIALLSVVFFTVFSAFQAVQADLISMTDNDLHSMFGQFDTRLNPLSGSSVEPKSDESTVNFKELLGLDASGLELTQGLELDIAIQTSFNFEYIDDDGVGEANNGRQGSLLLSGVNIGSSKTPITLEQFQSDTPFTENDLALLNNILIDVDSKAGLFMTIEEIGDEFGHGIDIIVQDTYLGNKSVSAGGLLIEDVSNFIQDKNLTDVNQLFGTQLVTADDGKNTLNGNWVPFYSKVLPTVGSSANGLESLIPSQDLAVENLGFPNITANTVIDASFVLAVDKLAWVDDGREFGLAGVMIYQGIDTNNDGIDDLVGPARLTQMKIETVDHKALDGTDVKALYIENLDFKADIAIQSIYVGSPEHSLGALHIKGLDTSGTSLWIYPH